MNNVVRFEQAPKGVVEIFTKMRRQYHNTPNPVHVEHLRAGIAEFRALIEAQYRGSH